MTGGGLRQLVAGVTLACAVIISAQARGEVTDISANGFALRESTHIAAGPDTVYAALIEPHYWWSSSHTFSGSAANMSLDAHAGGCWCERLSGGGTVLHMVVVYAEPGKILRLRGGLGPFQAMAAEGVLTWTLAAANGGTDVTLVSSDGGYQKGGFDAIARGADGVFAEQLLRLKQFVETGSPQILQENKP